MKCISKLPYPDYISAMKEQMGSFTEFGMERFTGVIIGSFFSVTYHSGHEFNRRITNEKHRAIGFAVPCSDGTRVSCVRLAGMTNPMSLLVLFCFCILIAAVTHGFSYALMPEMLLFDGIITVVAALVSAFRDSVTERGQEGSRILTAFLVDPVDFYSLVNKF